LGISIEPTPEAQDPDLQRDVGVVCWRCWFKELLGKLSTLSGRNVKFLEHTKMRPERLINVVSDSAPPRALPNVHESAQTLRPSLLSADHDVYRAEKDQKWVETWKMRRATHRGAALPGDRIKDRANIRAFDACDWRVITPTSVHLHTSRSDLAPVVGTAAMVMQQSHSACGTKEDVDIVHITRKHKQRQTVWM
jgi:hypothetical protein